MEPREKLQALLALIEGHHRQARQHHTDLTELAEGSHTRLSDALGRYQAVLPALGAGANPALEREYAERLQDHHGMALAPLEAEEDSP